jgi:hypothetical protein
MLSDCIVLQRRKQAMQGSVGFMQSHAEKGNLQALPQR